MMLLLPIIITLTRRLSINNIYLKQGTIMKNIQISDELYEQLKSFVVDPFDDTPEKVISRIADIADKAKNQWSPLDDYAATENQNVSEPQETEESLVAL